MTEYIHTANQQASRQLYKHKLQNLTREAKQAESLGTRGRERERLHLRGVQDWALADTVLAGTAISSAIADRHWRVRGPGVTTAGC